MNEWLGIFWDLLGDSTIIFIKSTSKEVGLKKYPKSPNNIIHGSSCQGSNKFFSKSKAN
jgi:hypothetical protein